MADAKISALTSATTPIAGTEVLPIVQSGATVKIASDDLTVKNIRSNATSGILQITGPAAASTRVVTVPNANWTAARIDAAQSFTGDQTLATGNIIQGTAAKGVNFTANTPAAGMTSQLLNWYEEGTYTATIVGLTTSPTTVVKYTRIGRQVTLHFDGANVTGTSNAVTHYFTGLPASLIPATQALAVAQASDNAGTTIAGLVTLFTDGNVYIAKNMNGDSWTASGTSTVAMPCITYSL